MFGDQKVLGSAGAHIGKREFKPAKWELGSEDPELDC